MDFLEIRRKAKERAAARAAAAPPTPAGPPPAAPQAGPDPGVRRPLALDPLPLAEQARTSPAPTPVPVPTSPWPEPESARGWAPPPEPAPAPLPEPAVPHLAEGETERLAEATAAEAARIEAELEARLREMPAAPDGRFRTWRPSGAAVPDLAPIAPEEPAPDEARRRGEGPRRRGAAAEARHGGPGELGQAPGDPLDEFFYRVDEPGPELGGLAAPAEATPTPAEVLERVEYLTFLLGAEAYGVEIDRVREVMRSPPITEVPRAPADVLGVITVRGEVVAVFDPRRRLGLPRGGGSSEGGRVIIVDDGAGACGLLVDGVASVVRLPRGSIEPCPQGIGGASADCLEGIGRDHDHLFTVLSVSALLRPARRAEGRG
jgi:purine-binding chemotaxis protein CheW